ncbi:MAG: DNA polymerase III subunit delta [Ignavibacteriae bacterium]|nr:DNA polymerase III subunit delta [Ignavibacteriota bacterium]
MAKDSSNITSIYSLVSNLSKEKLNSIYFLFGEDHFTINNAVKRIEKVIEPFLSSDFDKEVINTEKKANLSELIDLAYTFPFGSEKKLVIVKNFENFDNKKQLVDYINDPSESTILVLVNYGNISNLNSEPYKTLAYKNLIFQARELKGNELETWVNKRAGQLDFKISSENIKALIEIVGEDKSLLEMQLQKFSSFLNKNEEITTEDIQKLSSATKEYSIFDLLNSLGKGNSSNSFKVMNNLLDNGKDMVFIINMLTKYFSVISQSIEMRQRNLNDNDASKAIGVSKYYYINCKNASYFMNESRLFKASKALYKTDLTLKTTNIDSKTLSTMLLTEIFAN